MPENFSIHFNQMRLWCGDASENGQTIDRLSPGYSLFAVQAVAGAKLI